MNWAEQLRDIFPSKWHTVFFFSYIFLYIFNGILIRLSTSADTGNGPKAYDYDTISVVLLIEVNKLFLAGGFYLFEGHSLGDLFHQIFANRILALYYLVPSVLYCVYNNLAYVSLTYFDPTTYYILLQLRIAITGIFYQIIFKRHLSRPQWMSLVILTVGCCIKQMGGLDLSKMGSPASFFNVAVLVLLVQIFSSCLAGVYNEYLLKNKQQLSAAEKPVEVHLMVQNCYMYLDSIVCNIIAVTYRSSDQQLKPLVDLSLFAKPLVILIILTNAFSGLSTSYFIKTFNSVMKSYTVGIELLFSAIICFLIFATPVDGFTVVSILVVSYATYLFARNPVISPEKRLTTV